MEYDEELAWCHGFMDGRPLHSDAKVRGRPWPAIRPACFIPNMGLFIPGWALLTATAIWVILRAMYYVELGRGRAGK